MAAFNLFLSFAILLMAPEIWSGKLRAKSPATARGYSMVKFAYLDDASFEVF